MSVMGITALIFVGALTIYATYRILDFVAFYFLVPSHPLKTYKREQPDRAWAIVTGASAGLGLGIATELIKNDFGVILLGHNESELAAEKHRLETSIPGAAIRSVVMDARTATLGEISALVQYLETFTITILVNNVGGNPVSSPPTRDLDTHTLVDVDSVIDLNVRFMARLTTLILPILGRKPMRPGQQSLILNLSSGAWVGLPWLVMYSATKSFNRSFSHSLARELEQSTSHQHIKCLTVIPGDVQSQSNHVGVPDDAPKAAEYGKWIVWTVDAAVNRRMRDLVPHWKHSLQIALLSWLSDGILTEALYKVMRPKKMAWEEYHEKTR